MDQDVEDAVAIHPTGFIRENRVKRAMALCAVALCLLFIGVIIYKMPQLSPAEANKMANTVVALIAALVGMYYSPKTGQFSGAC
jgi:4-hydroxybenzoate polyprenyltransferase